jgi:type IV pilus assembly protein PilB
MAGPVEKKKRLGDMLVQEGLLTPKQLDQAVEHQRAKGGRLGDILVDQHHCTEDQILSALAKRAGIPFVSSLSAYGRVPGDILSLISGDLARQWGVFPLAREGRRLTVALADPFVELDAVDDLKIHTGFDIAMVLTSGREIQRAVESFYPAETKAAEIEGILHPDGDPADAQMTTITNALLGNAAKMGANFIYLEPTPSAVQVRYRVRGHLHKKPDFSAAHFGPLVRHLKSLARMDTADRWLPQDGRIHGAWGERSLDVRVATLPTSNGEKVVLSLFDSSQALPMDLAQLGMDADTLAAYQRFLGASKGLVLVAGPAGSGKTATIYATLAALRSEEKHILSIEDPVERYVDGITQVQARSDLRLTLASGLQVFRRLAPDVVMASDILDVGTADG